MSKNLTVKDISSYLEEIVPGNMKEDFDNVGLLVGLCETEVKRVIIALDITDDVISEAQRKGAQLIISHHPIFFSCKNVRDDHIIGRKIIKLIQSGISAICMHTNLDASDWGVNAALALVLGLKKTKLLEESGTDDKGKPYGIPRYGTLDKQMYFSDFLASVKEGLNTNGLRYVDGGQTVRRVALCGGSGGSYLEKAYEIGGDTLVTADIKYDVFLRAKELGMNLIDGDHYCTENVICSVLRDKIKSKYPGLEVLLSTSHKQTAQFFV